MDVAANSPLLQKEKTLTVLPPPAGTHYSTAPPMCSPVKSHKRYMGKVCVATLSGEARAMGTGVRKKDRGKEVAEDGREGDGAAMEGRLRNY